MKHYTQILFQMALDTYELTSSNGARLYLTEDERKRFANAIDDALSSPRDREKRTFALLLYWSGCRISEALAVRYMDIDFSAGGIRFETLKRRKKIHRFVPLPPELLMKLDDVHKVKDELTNQRKANPDGRVWPMSRTTAWRAITEVMKGASIEGDQATPKGLRHSFVIAHMIRRTPEHMIQRWLGWSSRAMMEVYGRAVGLEEQELAARLWE